MRRWGPLGRVSNQMLRRLTVVGLLSLLPVACSVTDDTPVDVMDSAVEDVDEEIGEDRTDALDLDANRRDDADVRPDGSDTSVDSEVAEDTRRDVGVDSTDSTVAMDTDTADVDLCEGATWAWRNEECPEGAEEAVGWSGTWCYIDDATCVERMGVGEGVCYCERSASRLVWYCYPECEAQ